MRGPGINANHAFRHRSAACSSSASWKAERSFGWRLTQIPKSQALEFLLVSPIQPRQVFAAEALASLGRFLLVSLAGIPVLLALVLTGVIVPLDLWVLGLMPFAWGVVAGLGLTVWAYEPASVRRVGQVIGLFGVLVYLVVGILAGENLRMWLNHLPPRWATGSSAP